MILKNSEWTQQKLFKADFAIIGAGASGITLSIELEKLGFSVILIEGGDLNYSKRSQDLYSGNFSKRDLPYGLRDSRMRYFGGSTNCWAGVMAELDEEDFEKRNWIPYSGWPFSKKELIPWYRKAVSILNFNHNEIFDNSYPSINGMEIRPTSSAKTRLFGVHFRSRLKNSKKIKVFTEANFSKMIRKDDGKTVESIKIKTYNKKSTTIFAKNYIISCGGIENARVLLNTKTKDLKAIGNNYDNVGRFFSDHPIAPSATFITLDSNDYKTSVYNHENYKNIFHYKLPYAIQKKYKTLNICLTLWPEFNELNNEVLAAWNIKKYFSDPKNYSLSYDDIRKTLSNPYGVYKAMKSRFNNNKERISVRFQMEQSPNPNNRVSLINEKDELGLNKINLNWDFSEIERHSIDIAISRFADGLHQAKIGSIKLDDKLISNRKELPFDLRGGNHHSGTTRISDQPNNGVVDSNLKVYDTNNLYVCGSSVFPTNGWANPTFTIIALSLRLANHLKKIS